MRLSGQNRMGRTGRIALLERPFRDLKVRRNRFAITSAASPAVEPAELEFSLAKGTPGSTYDNRTVEKVF